MGRTPFWRGPLIKKKKKTRTVSVLNVYVLHLNDETPFSRGGRAVDCVFIITPAGCFSIAKSSVTHTYCFSFWFTEEQKEQLIGMCHDEPENNGMEPSSIKTSRDNIHSYNGMERFSMRTSRNSYGSF